MPNLNDWLAVDRFTIDEKPRAVSAWLQILDKPTVITIKRLGQNLTAQTVRIEYDDTARELDVNNRSIGHARLIVFGVKGHPTIPDTDIQRGDRFVVQKVPYEIDTVIIEIGHVQAIAELKE